MVQVPRPDPAKGYAAEKGGPAAPSGWVSLLGVARQLRAVARPQLDWAALAAGAARASARMQERGPRRAHRPGPARRLAWAALAVFLLLAGSLAGTALAAEYSTPGQALYPLKRAAEGARLALARGPRAKADVSIALAERRLEEVAAVCLAGTCPPSLLTDLDAATQAAQAAVEGLAEGQRSEPLEKLVALTLRQQGVLVQVLESAPAAARPALERALERSQRGHERARQALEKERGVPPDADRTPNKVRTPGASQEQHTPKGKKGKPTTPGRGNP